MLEAGPERDRLADLRARVRVVILLVDRGTFDLEEESVVVDLQ